MTDEAIREAAGRYHKAAIAFDDRRKELYQLIQEARESGRSLRDIGKLVGLSHSRIQQLGY